MRQVFLETSEEWALTVEIKNLAVDTAYFDQCVSDCFVGDRGVVVTGNKVTFVSGEKVDAAKEFCEKQAASILRKLTRHPLWGKAGGPDNTYRYISSD